MARAKKYANDAERVAAWRERHAIRTLSVSLPGDVFDALQEKVKRAQMDRDSEITVSSYVTNLIKQQVLRKR